MPETIINPPLPIVLALMSIGSVAYGTTSATVHFEMRQDNLPTSYCDALPLAAREIHEQAATTTLTWMALANEALKESRPMTDWEREVAADIFWSEFD